MQTGSAFSKVYPQLGKTVIRTFTLSPDLRTIRWSPTSSGSKNSIEISSIKELRIGRAYLIDSHMFVMWLHQLGNRLHEV